MKIPKTIKIGGHIVKIEYNNKDNKSGTCYGFQNLITINKDAQKTIQEVSLIHEILEYITGMNDINFNIMESPDIQKFSENNPAL